MKYGIYIYGRTLQIDFRDIVSPIDGLPLKSDKLVRQLINTDVPSNGNIERLRYLFVRDSDKVLFGIGFDHRQFLSEELWTDYTGKRGLRSFVGITMDLNEFEKLSSFPTDYMFYINIYLEYIKNVWELDDRPQNRVVIECQQKEIEVSSSWCKLDGTISFNHDNHKCRFFPLAKENEILKSLKRCHSSVMVGLNVESHVTSAFRRFNVNISNALCLNTVKIHDFVLCTDSNTKEETHRVSNPKANSWIKQETYKAEDVEQTTVSSQPALLSSLRRVNSTNTIISGTPDETLMNIDWGDTSGNSIECANILPQHQSDEQIVDHTNRDTKGNELSIQDYKSTSDKSGIPKKEFRPKLMITFLASVLALVILLTIPKKCKTNTSENFQNTSTSGDTIKKEVRSKPLNSFPTKKKKE